jgi:AcrR family transcriptional regulator
MDAAQIQKAAKAPVRRPQAERRAEAMEAILDAAEREFARRGRDAATLRAIALEAGMDAALVHYYFGDKHGVFRAVLARKFSMVNAIYDQAMDDYEARVGGALTIEGVLDVFLRPYCEMLVKNPATWTDFSTILARTGALQPDETDIMRKNYDPIVLRFIDMLMRVSPATPREDIYWFFQIVSASLTNAVTQNGRIDALSGGLVQSSDIMSALRSMIAVLSRGFQAIVPAQ